MALSPLSLIKQSPHKHSWSWYLVPLNACGNGFGLFVPLYLLQLGGSVVEVALAAFLTGLASTIGSFVWGKLIDALDWRATVVIISASSTLIISVITYFTSDISSVISLWTVLGFLTAGGGPATNLLIMQRSKREEWSDTFSWTSLVSNVGIVIGMVAGFVWLAYSNDIHSYAVACGIMAGIAAAVVFPQFRKEQQEIGHQKLAKSIDALPDVLRNIVLGAPAVLRSFTEFAKGQIISLIDHPLATNELLSTSSMIAKVTRGRQALFFVGVGIFFLSGNLFYTPYTPYLKANGITDSQVFLAYAVLTISKVLFLPFNNRIVVAGGGEKRMAKLAYIPRMAGTAVAIIAALFAVGNPGLIFIVTLVAFVSVDVAFSMWSITTTSSLMQIIPSGQEGKIFGINQAVTGIGLLAGSMIGGEVAAKSGYPATFSLSIVALAASLALISLSFRRKQMRAELQVKHAS